MRPTYVIVFEARNMPYTLFETLSQIDPYVQLNDGQSISTVATRLLSIDHSDLAEYAIGVDAVGRILIYRLNLRGYPIRPPAFVEQKPAVTIPAKKPELKPSDFGFSLPGYV